MSITKGTTYGVTEQITNTKLHTLVDSATISLELDEFSANVLTSLPSTAGMIPQHTIIQSMASGAQIRSDGDGGWYASMT